MCSLTRERPMLVWDIDDVFNSLTMEIAGILGVKLPSTEPWYPNPASFMLAQGIKQETYIDCLDNFRRVGFLDLEPKNEVLQWFVLHGHEYANFALTSTPIEFFANSASWVLRHFSPWIEGIGFTPSRRDTDPPGVQYLTKSQYLQRFRKPYLLIDDSLENTANIDHALGAGIQFPTPWNSAGNVNEFLGKINEII